MAATKQRADPRKSLVGFMVGDVRYAVRIGDVQEIVTPTVLTELPHAPPAIAGVADHREQVIPILDLRVRFGLPRLRDHLRSKWILVRVEDKTMGLAVDRVTDVFGTGGMEIRPAPALGGGQDLRGILGVTSHEGNLVFVLDTSRFYDLVADLPVDGRLGAGEG